MAANRAVVSFTDGSTQEVTLRPKATIAAERKYGKEAHGDRQIEASFYMVWYTLGMPGGSDGFMAWLDSVEDLDPVEEASEAGSADDPTDPPPLVSSATSPS